MGNPNAIKPVSSFLRDAATKSALFLICWMAFITSTSGQNLPKQYEPLRFDKRDSFGKFPANWTLADSVVIHPDRPAPLKVIQGNKTLVGKPGEATTLSVNAKNFKLWASYVLSPKASVRILLPGGAFVLLTEGHPKADDQKSGYTGQFPIQDAGKIAGLTQTVEIDFESDIRGLSGKTRINEVKINGVVVQQGLYLPSQPFSAPALQVIGGTAVFKAIGVQKFENRQPVSLANLTYKIYNDAWDSRKTNMLGQSGSSPVLTCEVAEGKKSYNLVYEGDLVIEENGDYNFTTIYTGAYCQLSFEGNVVLDTDESSSQETHVTNVRLETGTHKFRLWYSKLPWRPAALGLRVGKSGIRDYDLHALASLPEPPAKPFIVLEPGADKPEMIRSFIQLPYEKSKRTHCISVGAPTSRNYSVDLNRGSLLQVWSGEFANATEMLYERGEPQLLTTMGLTEPISGRSSFVRLADQNAVWQDSSAINFLDYRLNKEGYPTFRYSLGPSVLQDAITTHEKGITRTITPERNASGSNYVLLAEGSKILLIERGLYIVDGRYYIKTTGNQVPLLRNSSGRTELLLPVASPVSYSILW